MFWSICVNAALAFGMILVFLYCLGDVDDVAASIYPVMAICLASTGSLAGSTVLVVILLLTVLSVTLGSVASCSRLTWAWARDGALPSYLAKVDPKHRLPLRSVWLPIFIVMLLSLLNLANYTAFSVIVSLSTFGLYQSYFIAIGCMLHARLTGRTYEAPWSLGRAGIPVNAFALLFSAWIGIFLVFPSYLPITAAYMNYALPINALVWLIAIVLWFAWGRKNWKGLNHEVMEKVVADSDRATKD
jgi:choline transport protein